MKHNIHRILRRRSWRNRPSSYFLASLCNRPTLPRERSTRAGTPACRCTLQIQTPEPIPNRCHCDGVRLCAGARGVLIVSDLWGWNSGRVRIVADYIAKSMNAFTVVPRLLDNPPLEDRVGASDPAAFALEAAACHIGGRLGLSSSQRVGAFVCSGGELGVVHHRIVAHSAD